MAEKDFYSHVFDNDDLTVDLDVKTEICFSKKHLPKGEMVPVFVDGKKKYVLIPLDIKDGMTLTVNGGRKHNPRSGRTGDLYVLVHISEDRQFPRKAVLIAVVAFVEVIAVVLLMSKIPTSAPEPTTEPTTEPTAVTCIHSWIAVDCTAPKTCSKCGESIGEIIGHVWSDANYNAPQICTVCGETEGEKKTPASSLGLRDIVSSSSASSVYSGDNLGRHAPEKLYDGKLDTNWTEDASGNGIGEYVVFNFDDTYAVNKFRIYIGSHYNEAVYRQNCRPKAITLTFSDGSTELVRLNDSYDEQVITLKQYYYTECIKLTIEEVYTGTKYLDTVIAELDFTAYRT